MEDWIGLELVTVIKTFCEQNFLAMDVFPEEVLVSLRLDVIQDALRQNENCSGLNCPIRIEESQIVVLLVK